MQKLNDKQSIILEKSKISLKYRLYKPSVLVKLFKGPYKISSSGWIWWIKTPDIIPILLTIDRFLDNKESKNVIVLKSGHPLKRRFYRIINLDRSSIDYFAKHSFNIPLRKRIGALLGLRGSMVGRNHLTAECINTEVISKNTPHGVPVLAFGEYIKLGLPAQQILIQPFLGDYKNFYEYWDGNLSFEERVQLMSKLIDLLTTLHRLSICHRDLHLKNIMVPNDKELPLKLIDCVSVILSVQPAIATAVDLGTLLYELNGKRDTLKEDLENAAQSLLKKIVKNDPCFLKASKILSLLLRYSFYGKRATKHLLFFDAKIKINHLEQLLKMNNINNPEWLAYGKRHECELINALNTAIKNMQNTELLY
ncbi:MAG TPA: hypothetical protein PKN66_04735 [Thermodesulfovibrio thiophilus]|nr:hypothetical protein [Thermodesulfovibrio thiophilus]